MSASRISLRLSLLLLTGLVLIAARGHNQLEKGYALLRSGKYEQAKRRFNEAAEEFKRKGIPLGLFLSYEGLGDIARTESDAKNALEFYKLSLSYIPAESSGAKSRIHEKMAGVEDDIYQRYLAGKPESWQAYDAFMAKHPSNRNAGAARQERDGLQYTPYLTRDTMAGYLEFVDTFPANLFVPKAVEKVYAIWQRDFGTQGPVDGLADYEAFLFQFPHTRLRAAALVMKSYYQALLADDYRPFAEFYAKHRTTKIPLLGFQEQERLVSALQKIAERQRTAAPFLLLFENTGNQKHLERATEMVQDAREESYFVKRSPRAYFGLGKGGSESTIVGKREMLQDLIESTQEEGLGGLLRAAYVPKLETTAKPVFDIPLHSRTAFGRYKVDLEFTMKVRSSWRMTGVLGALGELAGEGSGEEIETYTAKTSAILGPRSQASVRVEFPEITTSFQQSMVGLAGIEQTREILELVPRITSVRLADAGVQEWDVAVSSQELQGFSEAARQFNSLASINRSAQIDELENLLVAGIRESMGGQSTAAPTTTRTGDTETEPAGAPAPGSRPTIVLSGTVLCKSWAYEHQQLEVYMHSGLGWSKIGSVQTDREGHFKFSSPASEDLGAKGFKFVGACGEEVLWTSRSLADARVKLD